MEDDKTLDRQRCEVYSRVVGYIRPVDQWNPGKQSEFDDRKMFNNLTQTACPQDNN